MHRLFVAIRPPADVRTELLDLMNGITGARWQEDEQLHLTLRFVGEVDRHRANDLADALGSVRFSPFDIALAGVGCFDRKGHVHTLWAGAQPRDPLAQLHQKVDRACVRAGLPPDERSYLPHVTLARFGRTVGSMEAFMARHAGLTSPPFTVEEFTLFESQLGPAGSTYHMVERYRADTA
ncbi:MULTISPECIES: RNA 2',3'-cyclic phosphodiesterase [Sphingobium]|uniref:RNA 2',3'-cyclic phosphodiesterase n=1 Tax=Sphingobium chungbukense TaxID=56193 RepID=A0A0M3ALM2_9SPHN|nr:MULTISPECIES: RNA 2',3'-cyclic phosphodiesterase [Sphingobium]KKW91027.1 2'-5' RNA ligase [Sphingobium chungbukense]PJG49058.1 2'-5' RNA ligase [Sphingobium sp. LB126]